MRIQGFENGRDGTIALRSDEAARLGCLLATANGQDADADYLRDDILLEIGKRIFANPHWYKTLPFATENRPTNYEMGIVKLFERARAIPAIRTEADGVLKSCANSLAMLIEKAGPRAATPSQMAHRKEGR